MSKVETYPGPGDWPTDLVGAVGDTPEVVWTPYVVVRPWEHGTLYTCSICGNYPDFPTREDAEIHIRSHSTTTA